MRTLLVIATVIMLGGCATHMRTPADAADTTTYRCDNGQVVHAQYFPPDAATVRVDGRSIDMHIARSADGARYVGGGLTWWTKGSGPGSMGTLFTYDPDTGITGERITICTQV